MRKQHPETARFTTVYAETDFLNATNEALQNPSVQAAEVSEILGCSTQYAKKRLKSMADSGLIEGRIIGNVWTYRLRKE